MPNGTVGFDPLPDWEGGFRCFWCLDSGWGRIETGAGRIALEVISGQLTLTTLQLPFLAKRTVDGIELAGNPLEFAIQDGEIRFAEPCTIEAGATLGLTVAAV